MWGTARILQLITCILEGILAIPILGGTIVLSLFWTPLVIMLVLHIITVIFCAKEGANKAGSIIGIIASVLGAIPFVGWALHLATAIVLLVAVVKPSNQAKNTIAG